MKSMHTLNLPISIASLLKIYNVGGIWYLVYLISIITIDAFQLHSINIDYKEEWAWP